MKYALSDLNIKLILGSKKIETISWGSGSVISPSWEVSVRELLAGEGGEKFFEVVVRVEIVS